jgi:hypothetical protein
VNERGSGASIRGQIKFRIVWEIWKKKTLTKSWKTQELSPMRVICNDGWVTPPLPVKTNKQTNLMTAVPIKFLELDTTKECKLKLNM